MTIEHAPASDSWAIVEIHPRRSKLALRPSFTSTERVVASNIDRVVAILTFAKPEPHARLIDRFLVAGEANGISARDVMSKCKLVEGPIGRAFIVPLPAARARMHITGVETRGFDALREALAQRRSALSRPSAVDKSSLLSALYPGPPLRIGVISEPVNKQRHSKVGAELLLRYPMEDSLPGPPTLREVDSWGIDVDALSRCFPELRPYLGTCRSQDCAHREDKGCAVFAAAEDGSMSGKRCA